MKKIFFTPIFNQKLIGLKLYIPKGMKTPELKLKNKELKWDDSRVVVLDL